MKRVLFALSITAFLLAAFPQAAQAGSGGPLCLPGVYSGVDCLEDGPAAYLNRMQRLGITFPLQPLRAGHADQSLAYLPYAYAEVTADQGRIYNTLEDAIAVKPVARYLPQGFNYVTYVDVQVVDGKKYYLIAPNEWMRAGDLAANAAYSQFMGLTFTATPTRSFGWVLGLLEPVVYAHRAPGNDTPLTEHRFSRFDVIQVYDTQEADGLTWYMVGPDQWLERSQLALVFPVTQAPDGVDNGRWIAIDLDQQTISVYENTHLVYATLVSTGVPGFWTRPGLFQIREKLDSTPMTGAFEADKSDFYYLEDVPWTMYFDEARALHGAYWHTKFGFEQSHGCVNLSPGDAKWFYDWAHVGDWVYVWDASGKTPTDPNSYGSGAP